jgi:hypothetical protein
MGQVARQRRTRYLFWQLSLPPDRGDVGEERVGASNIGAFRLTHFFFVFFL